MRNTFSNLREPVPRRRRLLIATVIVLLVFSFDILSGGLVRALARGTGSTMWGVGSAIGSSISGTGLLSSRRALQEENTALKQQLAQLRVRDASFQVLMKENASLRALARLPESSPGITAPVISSVSASPYGTFLIGAGIEHGVKKGDLVALSNGSDALVIGRVDDARKKSSLVMFVFAPNARIEGTLRGAPIAIEGQGGGNARSDAPRGLTIEIGDPVIAPSLGGRAIGIVGKVDSDPARTFQKVYIGLPVGLSEVSFVYVIPFSQ